MNTNQVYNKLPASYYLNEDVLFLAKDLIGKKLVTNFNNNLTSGMIVETEAYRSINDKASHAYLNKKTKKNEMMYSNGGVSYVYMCYGIHSLFNIVTNRQNIADAILIRAIEPVDGIETMKERSSKKNIFNIGSGPGKLSMALGINMNSNGEKLTGHKIWIQDTKSIQSHQILSGKRIGVDYAGKDSDLPWRFYIKDNKHISKK